MLRGAPAAALLAAAVACGAGGSVSAQTTAPEATEAQSGARSGILIFDRDKALRESLPARRIADAEREARAALREELDQLRLDLEKEEAEITVLRESGPRDVFEERVRAFDRQVREARVESQRRGEAHQTRFTEARRRLAAALQPLLQEMLAEMGASIVVDARNVVAARPGSDLTAEIIRRVDARADEITAEVLASEGGR